MDFSFGSDELMMGKAASALLAEVLPFAELRAAVDAGSPFRREHWAAAAGAGWTGALVPEEFGGSGVGLLQMALPLVECGAALLPVPAVEGLLSFPVLLARCGAVEQRRRWLPAISAGEVMPTMRLRGSGSGQPGAPMATAEGQEWRVRGFTQAVPFGADCDVALIEAQIDRSPPGDPVSSVLLLVERGDPGVRWTSMDGFDLTSPAAVAEFDDVRFPPERVLAAGASVASAARLVSVISRIGSALLAVGGMKRLLTETTEYVTVRVQFGRPIASFQAVKHHAAEMRYRHDVAEPAAYYAAWAFDNEAVDATEAASVAYVAACEGFLEVAKTAIQLHGAIGYTWDRGLHLYLRRAQRLIAAAESTRSVCSELGRQARMSGISTVA